MVSADGSDDQRPPRRLQANKPGQSGSTRPEEGLDWKMYEAARRRGEFTSPDAGLNRSPQLSTPRRVGTPLLPARYREAARRDATRARAQTFKNSQSG